MPKLSPQYLYRLRLLLPGPRFYRIHQIMDYLERHGLVERTGGLHPDRRYAEYVITAAGRRELEAGS